MKPEMGVAGILFFTLSALARIGRAVRWASLQRLCLPECRFVPAVTRATPKGLQQIATPGLRDGA
jgi:hypothetical protein